MVQAYILEALLLKINATLNCMLCLDVPEDELMRRLLERGKISGRSDDNEEVIKSRLVEYNTKTFPVIDFYKARDQYIPIDGMGPYFDSKIRDHHRSKFFGWQLG